MVIDVRDMRPEDQTELDLTKLCQLFKSKRVIPVGIRGLLSNLQPSAIDAGLAIMKSRDISLAEGRSTSPIAKKAATQKPQSPGAKVLTRPVRSGTQVYAKDTDLVVMSAINPGAECLADGNIHVYGPLRGRALAGANGNENAHIFCESLDAELISIAGHYLTKEQIKIPKLQAPMIHVFLQDGKLVIDGI